MVDTMQWEKAFLLTVVLISGISLVNAASMPTYDGNPRVWYDYNGDEPSECEAWKRGDISTDEFQTNTDYGEGTAALSLKPLYNDYPRVYYRYSGDEPDEYEAWVVGNQTTDDFQTDTSYGEGTAALDRMPLYKNHPRAWWIYNGDEIAEYQEWADGNQTTDDFQTDTSYGEGTAALEVGNVSCGSGDGGDASLSIGASYSPDAPTTDDEVTIEASTDGTTADTITLFLDGSQVKECSSATSCSYSAGTLSSGDHTYQATASKDGTTTETGSLTFYVESSDILSVNVSHSPESPTTDDSITLEAETTVTAGTIRIFQGGSEVNSCSDTTTCSADLGIFSEGTYQYQATASADGASAETDVKEFEVGSSDDDGGDSPPDAPDPSTEVTFDLSAGWNMISVPHGGLSLAAEEITDDCSLEETASGEYAYTFPGEDGYAQTSSFQGFNGYWVNVASSCTATYTADAYSDTDSAKSLSDGWNMISPGNGEAASLEDIAGTCSFETSDGVAAYWYNPSEGTYETYSTSDALQPNRGYWVNVDGSCELAVTSVPPPPEA